MLHDSPVNSIKRDGSGQYWIADSEGLATFDRTTQTMDYQLELNGPNSPFPENTYISSIYPVKEDCWLSTNRGLFYWTQMFQQFPIDQIQLNDDQVSYFPSFVGAIDDNRWVFVERTGGLLFTDSTLKVQDRVLSAIPTTNFRAAKNADGTVYVGSNKGLFFWQPGDKDLKRYPNDPEGSIDLDQIRIWSIYLRRTSAETLARNAL